MVKREYEMDKKILLSKVNLSKGLYNWQQQSLIRNFSFQFFFFRFNGLKTQQKKNAHLESKSRGQLKT